MLSQLPVIWHGLAKQGLGTLLLCYMAMLVAVAVEHVEQLERARCARDGHLDHLQPVKVLSVNDPREVQDDQHTLSAVVTYCYMQHVMGQ